MIYTVTFNPSLDYIVSVNEFKTGLTNRTCSELILPGGKGVNVSIVLMNLGIPSTALGFIAGFTGDEVARKLETLGVKNGFIKIEDGFTRINVKLKSIDGTEINGRGPKIREKEVQKLMRRLNELSRGDILFLSGSIPASVPDNIYQKIIKNLYGRGVQIVVDAEKDLLLNVLPYYPFLIKPNQHELEEIFGVKLKTRSDAVAYAKKLQNKGARNVLVSLSKDGAVLAAEDGNVYDAPAPKGEVVNSVGAGDSMAAGFMAGWMEKEDYEYAFYMGIAAGSASAFSEHLAKKEEIEAMYKQITEIK